MKRLLIASLVALAALPFHTLADEPPVCGSGLVAQYNALVARLPQMETAAPTFVPPAPTLYETHCRDEADYAERDRLQEEDFQRYLRMFMADELQFARDFMSLSRRLTLCGLEPPTWGADLARLNGIRTTLLLRAAKYLEDQSGTGKFDRYMPVISAILGVLKTSELTGGDSAAVFAAAAELARGLLDDMFRRLRAEHDYRLTPKAFFRILQKIELLGGFSGSELAAYMDKVAASHTFDVSIRNDGKMDGDDEKFDYVAGDKRHRVALTWLSAAEGLLQYRPTTLDIPYREGHILADGGGGDLVAPETYETEFRLELRPCIDEPKVFADYSRFGAEEETFLIYDDEGNQTEESFSSPLHGWTTALMQMGGFATYIPAHSDGYQEWSEMWRFSPPLRNLNAEIVDKAYQKQVDIMSTKITLQFFHVPQ